MKPYSLPTDDEIRAACAQGEDAVRALFQRALIQRAAAHAADGGWPDPPEPSGARRAEIRQGDVYWVAPDGYGAGVAHPHVVIQEDAINRSRVESVVVCALTSNRARAGLPGNLLLEPGEANLPRASVVEVSKVSVVRKAQLGAYAGSLSPERVRQILAGLRFLQSITGSSAPEP